MADRVSASITIGGTLAASAYSELAEIIACEGLSTDWHGERFEPEHHVSGEPLSLHAHDVAWGRFDDLETWCLENKLPFSRWSGAYGGEWSAERVVFTGDGEPQSYMADEEDRILIDRETVARLGSLERIIAYFDAADIAVPPLIVEAETAGEGAA